MWVSQSEPHTYEEYGKFLCLYAKQMYCIVGASLSKLTKLWQEYIKHKPYVHMLLCGNVKEMRRL